jgi:hypothetical protein
MSDISKDYAMDSPFNCRKEERERERERERGVGRLLEKGVNPKK